MDGWVGGWVAEPWLGPNLTPPPPGVTKQWPAHRHSLYSLPPPPAPPSLDLDLDLDLGIAVLRAAAPYPSGHRSLFFAHTEGHCGFFPWPQQHMASSRDTSGTLSLGAQCLSQVIALSHALFLHV